MRCPRCTKEYDRSIAFCPEDGAPLSESLLPPEPDSSQAATAPKVVGGRYELGRVVGHGATARVYEATDRQTGLLVAVKILSRLYATDSHERRRFLREAEAVIGIDHPNVIRVLDYGRLRDGRPYIVTEFLKGGSLGELLRRERVLGQTRTLRIVRDTASALQAAHRIGVIHRDIKPDNILLVGSSEAPEVRVVDFGLSKRSSHESSRAGTTLGTPAYMPPEQVLSEPVDSRSDVYSLGVVMFRCLTGYLPFVSEDDVTLLAHQLLMPPPPPSWLLEGLDPRIEAVVIRALRKLPENRFPDMAAMLHSIQAVLGETEESQDTVRPLIDPDIYRPRTALGRHAARHFCDKLGMSLPEWLQSDGDGI
jgi:eukaryotic-like serine/threonine-protein kinase